MSEQRPPRHPAPRPGPRWSYAPPQVQQITDDYRRRATLLTRFAIAVGALMAVALVISVVFLVQADSDSTKSGLGYLALVLWAGITVATPVLVALVVPAVTMTRRVRRQEQARTGGWGAPR
ncbi:hypothetical protein [Streptomyces sp. NPDC059639]|uniref:hypothetical protein n=1 Tax=Streptomyces sp. NPDC059639 TaxID=3346891 RepID=UPI00368968E3